MAQRNPSEVALPWPGLTALGATVLAVGIAVPGLMAVENHTWLLTRAAGLIAFALLWLSVVLGLLQSTGYFRAAGLVDLHTFVSVWALYMTTFHIVILLYDRHAPFTLPGILIPFESRLDPVWTGVGGLAFYITLGVTVTTYFRGQIGMRAWRAIHLSGLVAFALALLHGVLLGTDSSQPWVAFSYRFAALSVAGLLGFRVLLGVRRRANPAGGR